MKLLFFIYYLFFDKNQKKIKKTFKKKNIENKKKEKMKEENTISNININDTIQVYFDIEKSNVDAKVLQIKIDESTNKKLYYVHFLNLEKRMDKWIDQSLIRKNYGKIPNSIDGANLINHSMLNDNFVLTRKRSSLFSNGSYTENENEIEKTVKIKNVEKIILGYYEINAWYFSPFPNEFTINKILYICEHCLKYMKYKNTLIKHLNNCSFKNPPGKKIYEMKILPELSSSKKKERISDSISVYEIKGSENKLYCQNLCLIAKLFLDHKSIYFDVSPFKFYVLTENDKNGNHIVAYFSKEVSESSEYNLSCIMVLPPFQRKGYGQFLISLSYYLSNKQNKICTPETPLSDLGKISYKSYWTITILDALLKNKGNLCVKDLSEQTGIKPEDITYTLNELSLIKYWKGQQVVIKQIEEFLNKKKASKKNHVKFNEMYIINN